MKNALFFQGPDPLFRLFLFCTLSVAMIVLDARFHALETVRAVVGNTLYPVLKVADAPFGMVRATQNFLSNHRDLITENRRLHQENHILKTQLLQLQALKAENQRLQDLLNSSRRLGNQFLASRLLAVGMEPLHHLIIIDKGSQDHVEKDMPILDEFGVMGHITRVYAYHAEAMLISDPSHAIPVTVTRNGIRSIAVGEGRTDELKLLYLPINADIKVGDELVTSGLGGKYPPGFPVGVVREIIRARHSAFAKIHLTPHARLDTSREILIVTTDLESSANTGEQAAHDEAPSGESD